MSMRPYRCRRCRYGAKGSMPCNDKRCSMQRHAEARRATSVPMTPQMSFDELEAMP